MFCFYHNCEIILECTTRERAISVGLAQAEQSKTKRETSPCNSVSRSMFSVCAHDIRHSFSLLIIPHSATGRTELAAQRQGQLLVLNSESQGKARQPEPLILLRERMPDEGGEKGGGVDVGGQGRPFFSLRGGMI